MAENSRCVQ